MLFAMQIKSFFFFFGCVLKPEGIGELGVSELFSMLVDECIVWEKGIFENSTLKTLKLFYVFCILYKLCAAHPVPSSRV